jgi:hypothetical protein
MESAFDAGEEFERDINGAGATECCNRDTNRCHVGRCFIGKIITSKMQAFIVLGVSNGLLNLDRGLKKLILLFLLYSTSLLSIKLY